jgi:hypothetical protein
VLFFYGFDTVEDFDKGLLEDFGVSVLEMLTEFLILLETWGFCWI